MDTIKNQIRKWWNKGAIVIVQFVVVFIALGGESTRLTCKRNQQSATVSCVKQSVLLWIVPLSTDSIQGVSGAQLSGSEGYEGGATYRVELLTTQGIVPLTSLFTSGYSTKRDVADEINTFVQNMQTSALEVTEPGMLSVENFICMLIWIPLAWAGSQIWGGIKSLFGGR